MAGHLHRQALSLRSFFWICSGIWLSAVLNQLAACVWKYLLHRRLSGEQEVILFAACVIACTVGGCITAAILSERHKSAADDAANGYETKPRLRLLPEICIYLLLNGGAGILMFFLLRWEDLHRLQN